GTALELVLAAAAWRPPTTKLRRHGAGSSLDGLRRSFVSVPAGTAVSNGTSRRHPGMRSGGVAMGDHVRRSAPVAGHGPNVDTSGRCWRHAVVHASARSEECSGIRRKYWLRAARPSSAHIWSTRYWRAAA